MAILNYKLGVLIGRAGLSAIQQAQLEQKIREVCGVVDGLTVMVPGFDELDPMSSICITIPTIVKRYEGKGVSLDVGKFPQRGAVDSVAAWISTADEVLAFPTRGSAKRSVDRVYGTKQVLECGNKRVKVFDAWADNGLTGALDKPRSGWIGKDDS